MYILLYVGMCRRAWIKVHLHSNDQSNHLRKETKLKKNVRNEQQKFEMCLHCLSTAGRHFADNFFFRRAGELKKKYMTCKHILAHKM